MQLGMTAWDGNLLVTKKDLFQAHGLQASKNEMQERVIAFESYPMSYKPKFFINFELP